MDRYRGGFDDFHNGSKEFDVPSPVNIAEKRDGEKETDYGEEDWVEGSCMMGLYGETYLNGLDGTVYR